MTTENTDILDEDYDEDDDDNSSVITELRSRIKELKSEIKDRRNVEADVRRELAREFAVGDELEALGHPRKMASRVLDQIIDDEINRDTVTDALEQFGYQFTDDTDETTTKRRQIEPPSPGSLSASVNTALNTTDEDHVNDIYTAQTREELAAIMASKGLTTDYTQL